MLKNTMARPNRLQGRTALTRPVRGNVCSRSLGTRVQSRADVSMCLTLVVVVVVDRRKRSEQKKNDDEVCLLFIPVLMRPKM